MNKAMALFLGVFSVTVFAAQTDISPIGKVRIGSAAGAAPVAAAPAAPKTGEEVYNTTCMACHATGAAGAPKLGDTAAWAPRIATGMDALLHSALNGKGAMPPKGGNTSLTDEEIKNTIEFMTNKSK